MPPVDPVMPTKRPILAISIGVSLTAFVAVLAASPPSGTLVALAVAPSADVAVTKSGPSTASPGTTITYTINVQNLGPSFPAAGVVLDDPTPPRLTFLFATGACSSFPCTIGSMNVG